MTQQLFTSFHDPPPPRGETDIEICLISMTSRKWHLKGVELRLGVVKSNVIDVPLTLSYSHLFSVISLPLCHVNSMSSCPFIPLCPLTTGKIHERVKQSTGQR